MENDDIYRAILEIQDLITGSDFEEWRKAFVNRNVKNFDYSEENKLVYSEIHAEYEAEIERRITNVLSYDMANFMESLPAYLEGEGKRNESIGKAIVLLLEVSDFSQFKEMMMFRKKEIEDIKEAKENDNEIDRLEASGKELHDLDVGEMMEQCATLASAAQLEDGWVNVLTNDWMKVDKKAVEVSKRKSASEIYLRGVWTMNLTVTQCCDMMFTFDRRRAQWDSNFKSVEFPLGGSQADDDMVAKVILNFGYLVNLVMFGGKPGELVSRNIRKWNHPTPGSVTYAMMPWSLATNSVDLNHKLLTLKTGTIGPHPTQPNKCVMTTLETNTMGGMPTWALHWMMRATAPAIMKGLEGRYLAYIKKTGDYHNNTPWPDDIAAMKSPTSTSNSTGSSSTTSRGGVVVGDKSAKYNNDSSSTTTASASGSKKTSSNVDDTTTDRQESKAEAK